MSFHDQHGFAPGDRVLAKVSPDEWWPAQIVRFVHLPTFTDPPLKIVPEIIFERDPYSEGAPCEWENIQPESIVDKLARLAYDELMPVTAPVFEKGDLVRPRHTPNRPVGRVTNVDANAGKVAVDFGNEFRWWYEFELEHADAVSALGRLA